MSYKYYVIEIADGDSKIAGKSIYEYEDENDAIAKNKAEAAYYKKLGTAKDSTLYTSDMIMLTDQQLTPILREPYIAPTASTAE